MAFREVYRRQVQLLIRVLPSIAEEACFALKGGTAINLFVRDMPRLSVDIDLTYLPVQPRAKSLAAIDAAMKRIADRIRTTIPGAQVAQTALRPENAVYKLLVRAGGVQIKIEVTPVLRGCVYDRNYGRSRPPSRKRLDSPKRASFPLQTFMRERWWPPSTGNTPRLFRHP